MTLIHEFDRLVGGGIVPGSLMLVGGEPGIGKSTLMLQLSDALARQGLVVLYVSGEESIEQTSMRAKRLSIETDNLLLLAETNMGRIKKHIEQINPDMLIVDSIQLVYKDEIASAPGSVTQVRENAAELMHMAKSFNIATFLIGHVTKSGEIAGPRVLEHIVDTVLYFEGDKQHNYRMIRVVKNRFGPTDEIAVFQMQQKGLVEVPNPSQIFLEERTKKSIGSTIIATIEGSSPILVEAQALVTDTPTALRRAALPESIRTGWHCFWLCWKSASATSCGAAMFLSPLPGVLRINEPSVDLGVLLAVASSFRNRMVDPDTVVIGEVGLGGEVRSVARIDQRIKEAKLMGFARCLIPKRNVKGISDEVRENVELIGVEVVEEAINYIK